MKRTSLPPRIADVLDDRDADERARAVLGRLATRPALRSTRRRSHRAMVLAAAAVLLTSASVLAWRATSAWREPSEVASASSASPSASTAARGRTSSALEPGRRALGEGTWVALDAATRATLIESPDSIEILLERGRIELEVRPGGRRVDVEAGLAHLSVIGTHFVVERGDELVVSVSRGRVLARGELVPERARMVGAGETLTVREPSSSLSPPDAPSPPSESAPERSAASPRARRATPWRDLADTGAYAEAWDALGPEGLTREMSASGPEDLLALADVARRSGHPARAVEPLELLLRRYPDDADAALGAFTLGRLWADALGEPAAAAEAFELALRSRLPSTLVPDALGRLALAHRAAGANAAAAAAATRYLDAYPDGPRAAELRAIAGPP